MKKQFNNAANPLISPPSLPHGVPAMDKVNSGHYLPAVDWALQKARARIHQIKTNKSAPTFKNTVEALEFAEEELNRVLSVFTTMTDSKSNENIRQIEQKLWPKVESFGNDVLLDETLFKRIKAVYNAKDSLKLTNEQKILLEDSYAGFKKNGALLSNADKKRLRNISHQLSGLTTKFSNNVLKSTEAYELIIDDKNLLNGLPQRALNYFKQTALDEGLKNKYLVKLEPPPIDILTHCKNRKLRETVWKAMNNVAYKGQSSQYDNSQTVLDIVKLRHEKAQLLGYKNYAEYALEDQMAQSPKKVMNFLHQNLKTYKKAAIKELNEIKLFANHKDSIKPEEFKPWDYAYYQRQVKEQKFSFDAEKLRPYFELNNVMKGMLTHFEKLFDVSISETTSSYPVYDKDVKTYEVFDKDSGDLLGILYSDNYARPGEKQGGAWMNEIRGRGDYKGVNTVPLITNNCNFPKPSNGNPTLLSIGDVETLFHEAGHAFHALLAKGKYPSLTGTNVVQDFVELPSQLQENWVHERSVLDSFARHYKTGQKIPKKLIDQLHASSHFGNGYAGLRQTFFGLLDMAWHTKDPSSIKSVEQLEDEVSSYASLFPRLAGPQSNYFSHLFSGGYAAGYYGYKWDEVLDADVFYTLFKSKNDLYDKSSRKTLRQELYEKGGTEEPMTIFKKLLGREPDNTALYKREGLFNIQTKHRTLKP